MLEMRNYCIYITNNSAALLGREGENNARTLKVKTLDDISTFAEIHLYIDTLDCGTMTISNVRNAKLLSMVIGSDMVGEAGKKTCQLVMLNSSGDVVLKSNQFYMYVTSSNVADRVYICTEDAIKAALETLIDAGILTNLELVTDKTLSLEDYAADAEAVGTALADLSLTQEQQEDLIDLLN